MDEKTTASSTATSETQAADPRRAFTAPEVQDLGRLQELTQLLQGTIILEPA